IVRAILPSVSPTCTGPYSPGAAATGCARGAGCAAGAGEGSIAVDGAGASAGGSAATGVGGAASTAGSACAGSAATGAGASGSRTMVLEGATAGASTGGCAGADTVRGASSSAEYSRTSLPCPQSTSTRKVSSDASTGSALVTRITGLPCGSSATVNCSPLTVASGGSSP